MFFKALFLIKIIPILVFFKALFLIKIIPILVFFKALFLIKIIPILVFFKALFLIKIHKSNDSQDNWFQNYLSEHLLLFVDVSV